MKIWRVPYPKFGQGPGLARVKKVAEHLGIELARFSEQGAVITGSNGKGSTAAMLASILRQTGKPVGLFTSPHLFRLNERFNIDGADISDEDLETHWSRIVAASEAAGESQALGGFEFLFLIAADWFAARGCAYTVWEAGIGGRFDPVRLIEARRTALTSLDLEHTELLGETLEEIASDKLDAAPEGATVFVGECCLPLRATIEAHCATRSVTPIFVGTRETLPPPLVGGGRGRGDGGDLSGEGAARTPTPDPSPQGGGEQSYSKPSLPLFGTHQMQNAAIAVALARNMVANIADEAIARGLEQTRWPGRLETIEREPLIVIDVGHTPDAIRVALDGFTAMRGEREGVLVCGCSADKKVEALIAALAPSFPLIVCAQARHKGAPAGQVAAAAASANPGAEIVIAESVADARKIALAAARGKAAAVYVAGGLFLAAEFKAIHEGLDPASLVFF